LETYTLHEGELLGVDLLTSEKVPDPKAKQVVGKPSTGPRKGAARPEYDLAHHTAKMSDKTHSLFDALRESIMDLGDDVTELFMNQYVGYRRLENFCEVVGQKAKLNLFIDGPVTDELEVGEDVSGIGHWGTGNLRVTVENENDLAAVMVLIKEAYSLQE
jgi:predicted transport protein